MNQNLPETDLHSRIQELEQQLRLAEQGASRLAQRNLALQQELATTENRIAAARRFYNGNVRAYNTRCAEGGMVTEMED